MQKAIVAPVLQTALNINDLIQACQAMQQPNPAERADEKGYRGLRHTITTMDEIQRRSFMTGSVLYVGYMIVTSWEDMPYVLSYTGGMPHLYHDGVQRVACVIVVGSINQWLDSCRRACSIDSYQTVRYIFNKIYADLQKYMLLDDRRDDYGDGTFLLEDLR